MSHFASKLSRFFYGEHPTRKTYYQHEDMFSSIRPARIVYTGNYIFKPDILKYFIPFAPLKLRMAGPLLGRLLKHELQEKFVSANLPKLHKRTVRELGQSEFRPGISTDTARIDLSGEFERQFYGDVLLFSIEKLIFLGFPRQNINLEIISETLEKTYLDMLELYKLRRLRISEKLLQLKDKFQVNQFWWKVFPQHKDATERFAVFMDNMEFNFSEQSLGYKLITDESTKTNRFKEMIKSIVTYNDDRFNWSEMLADSSAK